MRFVLTWIHYFGEICLKKHWISVNKIIKSACLDLQCVRPLLWKNETPDHPYSIFGTCFIIKYKNTFYGLTAKHVVNLRTIKDMKILRDIDCYETLCIEDASTIKDTLEEELSCTDLVICKLKYDSMLERSKHYHHLIQNKFYENQKGSCLYICGVPTDLSEYNPENKTASVQHIAIFGTDLGQTSECGVSNQIGLRTLKCSSTAKLPSFDGLSGSPVFAYYPNSVPPTLAGMVILGSTTSCLITFLDVKIIIRALEHIKWNSR